jgi:hypothetical protein
MGPVSDSQRRLLEEAARVKKQNEDDSLLQLLMAANDTSPTPDSAYAEGVRSVVEYTTKGGPSINVQVNVQNLFVAVDLANQRATIAPEDLHILRGTEDDSDRTSALTEGVKTQNRKSKTSRRRPVAKRSKHDHKLAVLHHRRRIHQSITLHRRTCDHAEGVIGVEWFGGVNKEACPVCVTMLGSKAPFKDQAGDRSAVTGFRIHTDAKILSVHTKKGHKILICFIDDNSRRVKC